MNLKLKKSYYSIKQLEDQNNLLKIQFYKNILALVYLNNKE